MSLLQRSILPASPSFTGHNTFPLRSGWLKKGFDALQKNQNGGIVDGSLFNAPEALAELGVGKNMVSAIRYWLSVSGIARESGKGQELRATVLGTNLLRDDGWDPFLEDEATLWLLHWQLSGPNNPQANGSFTWAYTFNHLRDWEFSREYLVDSILTATHSLPKTPSRETIDRDAGCLLQTYVLDERSVLNDDNLDCPLRFLGLLRPSHKGHFRFAIEAKPTLPAEIFFYALADFWQWKNSEARTLPIWEVCYGEGSPGSVFKLDETSVLEYLDGLETATEGTWRFDDNSQSRQVLKEDIAAEPMHFLEHYYARYANYEQGAV